DPIQGPTTTGDFRWPPINRPEQTLTGLMFNFTSPNTNYIVTNSSHWVYAGTGFQDGDVVPGIVGYESDSFLTNYPPPNSANQTLLSNSPFTDSGVTKYQNTSIYQAPSGAWVFASGTMSWSWALDDAFGPLQHFVLNTRIQRATANVLNAFVNGIPPTITSFTPGSGPAGASVTINGTNFIGATAVSFNGTAATYTVTSSTAIQTAVPTGATSGPIIVVTPGGTATSATNFAVVSPPTIAGFTPTSGPEGASVTINGTNCNGATAVTFNGTAANFSVTSDTTIQTAVPSGATTGPISVTTPGGTASSASNFTVLALPTITSFTPTSGAVGISVTINGTNLSGTTSVNFNGSPAAFSATSDTTIQAAVPIGATTGPLSVTTPAGTATSAGTFTVAPTITSFTPTSGPVGTIVTMNGLNFAGTTAVKFNGIAAAFSVDSATMIHATAPTGATTGPLSVTTDAGTATSAGNFTMAPSITSFTPTSGAVGITVTINGTNFTGASAVKFNATTASFTVTSATAIQAAGPTGATT